MNDFILPNMNDLGRYMRCPIYIDYYVHDRCDCYKIDMPYTAYAQETKVLCRVDEGIELARQRAKEILFKRIEESLTLNPIESYER